LPSCSANNSCSAKRQLEEQQFAELLLPRSCLCRVVVCCRVVVVVAELLPSCCRIVDAELLLRRVAVVSSRQTTRSRVVWLRVVVVNTTSKQVDVAVDVVNTTSTRLLTRFSQKRVGVSCCQHNIDISSIRLPASNLNRSRETTRFRLPSWCCLPSCCRCGLQFASFVAPTTDLQCVYVAVWTRQTTPTAHCSTLQVCSVCH